ncbi:MAG: glycosyltransferase family 4 protein, partial [Asgard group archaeon]
MLLLSPFFAPDPGGVATHLVDLCGYLSKKRYHVYVLTLYPIKIPKTEWKSYECQNKVKILRSWWIGQNLYLRLEKFPILQSCYLIPFLFVHAFSFFLSHHDRIGIVHAHDLPSGIVARILSKVFSKKCVISLHILLPINGKETIVRFILNLFDRILVISNKSKQRLVDIGTSQVKITTFYYWVDQSFFKPLNKSLCKEELGLRNKFVCLFVGRLLQEKGVRLLLEVAETFKDIGRGPCFLVVGQGPLVEEVKSASKRLKNVIYAGRVDNKNLGKYYSAADITVVPSMYEEGFGRVIIESLFCGTPVVASNRGAIPEALDLSVGRLLEPKV